MPTGEIKSLETYGIPGGGEKHMDPSSPSHPPSRRLEDRTVPIWEHLKINAPRSLTPTCFSSVSLTGIRRISVSAGLVGAVRGEEHVSGLRVEFFDSDIPVYVGQWFREAAVVRFELGDRITGLTFWLATEDDTHPLGGARVADVDGGADFRGKDRVAGLRAEPV